MELIPPAPLPDFWLTRPVQAPDAATAARFDAILKDAERNPGSPIDYRLDAPVWQFLCHVADGGRYLLHGSGNGAIEEFEPRKTSDLDEFGDQQAVYAASDGIWPMYYAILDRNQVRSLLNACFRMRTDGASDWDGPYYYFSINDDALAHEPWQSGFVYLLPAEDFRAQPLQEKDGRVVRIAQHASTEPVRPLARVAVRPEDFPFLDQIAGHDPAVIIDRAERDPDGFPWRD